MTRFGVWLLCCVVVTVSVLVARPEAQFNAVAATWLFLGAPLLIHWLFEAGTKP